ncbi:hypothetical protein [Thioalkalivibrio sp. XN279]|uniref:hypothetical protein n=1 Tax=Thioalkalivibrio sp. XN279 TaxID=2714953 RepID=UPI001408FC35|nr:hypothetical protein [Thioalkalivibrio sp. XN279]NHA15431.1 hypothetical protein [Thioalkalivibrio sp. XN279]
MKTSRLILMLPVVAAGMLVSGCAGMKPADETAARHEIDSEYVAAVERSARGMPVKIIWVNPPEKRVEDGAKATYTIELPNNQD